MVTHVTSLILEDETGSIGFIDEMDLTRFLFLFFYSTLVIGHLFIEGTLIVKLYY